MFRCLFHTGTLVTQVGGGHSPSLTTGFGENKNLPLTEEYCYTIRILISHNKGTEEELETMKKQVYDKYTIGLTQLCHTFGILRVMWMYFSDLQCRGHN